MSDETPSPTEYKATEISSWEDLNAKLPLLRGIY